MHAQARATGTQSAFDPVLIAAILLAPPVWWLLAPLVGTARSGDFWAVLAVVLLYPVLEELSFRGLLQGWLQELLGQRQRWRRLPAGISLPNLFTSLAFCAAHLPTQPLGWVAGAFLPSLLFGYLRDRTGSVLPPMALHVYYNAGLMLFMLYVR